MRTWSLESVFVRAYSAVVDKLSTLEGLTRPPRLGHDMDAVDGAEQLAEREAEDDYLDPDDFPIIRSGKCNVEDVPGQEPRLTDDELVAVRGLIQERYETSAGPFQIGVCRDDARIIDGYCGGCSAPLAEWERELLGAEPALTPDELVAVRRWVDVIEKGLHPDTGEVFAPREPMLRYSELWAVRQLLAERFDAEGVSDFQRAVADAYRAMTSSAGLCDREFCLCRREWSHGDFITRAEHERAAAEHLTPVEATQRRLSEHPDFAGAAASLADGTFSSGLCQNPSVSEDKQQVDPADPQSDSSADPLQASAPCGDARTADDSPSADDGHSPRPPAEGHPTWAGLAERMVNHLWSAKPEHDHSGGHGD